MNLSPSLKDLLRVGINFTITPPDNHYTKTRLLDSALLCLIVGAVGVDYGVGWARVWLLLHTPRRRSAGQR